jgi:hypothetical protein
MDGISEKIFLANIKGLYIIQKKIFLPRLKTIFNPRNLKTTRNIPTSPYNGPI